MIKAFTSTWRREKNIFYGFIRSLLAGSGARQQEDLFRRVRANCKFTLFSNSLNYKYARQQEKQTDLFLVLLSAEPSCFLLLVGLLVDDPHPARSGEDCCGAGFARFSYGC